LLIANIAKIANIVAFVPLLTAALRRASSGMTGVNSPLTRAGGQGQPPGFELWQFWQSRQCWQCDGVIPP
jgi:hypothetical protein